MQKPVIKAILQGQSCLVIMPTGMGKSLCYQLPSLLLPGLTVVVSPLIALMKDQQDAAKKRGIPCTAIHSAMTKTERQQAYQGLKEREYRLIYVTPERFRKEAFWQALGDQVVSLLAIDEAHCISQWGHDFRPDYSLLGQIRNRLGQPVTLALTATATPQVQKDILVSLDISASTQTFIDGVQRPNLYLAVEDLYGQEAKLHLVSSLVRQELGPTIIYFSLVSTLENFSRKLSSMGCEHWVYHGQLGDRHRRRSQDEFFTATVGVMLATPAFGLGVDKANIRSVIHAEVPGSLEAYFQEVGRAGRDGLKSYCYLLYDPDDVSIQMDFIKWSQPEPSFVQSVYNLLCGNLDRFRMEGADYLREQLNFFNRRDFRVETSLNLLERMGAIEWENRNSQTLQVVGELNSSWLEPSHYQERLKNQNKKLLDIVQWTQQNSCRKQSIYRYFGVDVSEPCGFCDVCSGRLGSVKK